MLRYTQITFMSVKTDGKAGNCMPMNWHSVFYIILGIAALGGIISVTRRGARSPSDTDEELQDEIDAATEVDDLITIAEAWAPYAFGEKQVSAFDAKATELKITKKQWREIYAVIDDDEGSPFTVFAKEKAGMGPK